MCTICHHPKRHDIELAALSGTSQRIVGRTYDVSRDALRRHIAGKHVAREIGQVVELPEGAMLTEVAQERYVASSPSELLDRLAQLQVKTEHILDIHMHMPDRLEELSEEKPVELRRIVVEDHKLALHAVSRAKDLLELQAKITGELVERKMVLHTSPEWHRVKAAIVEALDRFPEAKAAVLEALAEVD